MLSRIAGIAGVALLWFTSAATAAEPLSPWPDKYSLKLASDEEQVLFQGYVPPSMVYGHVQVDSPDLPVSVHRIYSAGGIHPYHTRGVFVAVKSSTDSCGSAIGNLSVTLTPVNFSVLINVNAPEASQQLDDYKLMTASQWVVNYNCTNAPGGPFPPDPISFLWGLLLIPLGLCLGIGTFGGGITGLGTAAVLMSSILLGPAIAVMVLHNSPETGIEPAIAQEQEVAQLQRLAQATPCRVQVEVIYPGCQLDINGTAPAGQLRTGRLSNRIDNRDTTNLCQDTLTFDVPTPARIASGISGPSPLETTPNGDLTDFSVKQSYGDDCLLVIGRPFRDAQSRIVLPKETVQQENKDSIKEEGESVSSPWTLDGGFDIQWPHPDSELPPDAEGLAATWEARARGEYASVASFASFTLDLLTNGAPPHLVQEALSAAQDETRHAQVSWAVVSRLTNTGREKNVVAPFLPPTRHAYGRNRTALALGAAQEGCVDETLAALIMAAEVDAIPQTAHPVTRTLGQASKQIALEEARHAALAWRTVAWVCQVDTTACKVVQDQVLNAFTLDAFGTRLAGSKSATIGWKCLYATLLPLLSDKHDGRVDKDKNEHTDADVMCDTMDGVVGDVIHHILQSLRSGSSLDFVSTHDAYFPRTSSLS